MIPANHHHNELRQAVCVVCGDNTSVEIAHVRYADLSIGKFNPGMGARHHVFAVPLCGRHHREQHNGSEANWWAGKYIDANKVALALFAAVAIGDREWTARICKACNEIYC